MVSIFQSSFFLFHYPNVFFDILLSFSRPCGQGMFHQTYTQNDIFYYYSVGQKTVCPLG